ncbi:hypothetical protein C9374_012354 [Naegleria lovaniensis]|uniref:Uncharacterized protein n=1 Tax=Naegleria lovaniensis TaxID=51637 RepID=A0AA88KEH9_NAELO|nr:uncharacterized protein C9374_012354 [Naegleria lovaniensis]KAG2373251.1 hypothetical protein C9374_012354 [Naegleria lovaniensis]
MNKSSSSSSNSSAKLSPYLYYIPISCIVLNQQQPQQSHILNLSFPKPISPISSSSPKPNSFSNDSSPIVMMKQHSKSFDHDSNMMTLLESKCEKNSPSCSPVIASPLMSGCSSSNNNGSSAGQKQARRASLKIFTNLGMTSSSISNTNNHHQGATGVAVMGGESTLLNEYSVASDTNWTDGKSSNASSTEDSTSTTTTTSTSNIAMRIFKDVAKQDSKRKNGSNSSPTEMMWNSKNGSKMKGGIEEIRNAFFDFLGQVKISVTREYGLAMIQKMHFLDVFYDVKKQRVRTFDTLKQLFKSCESFLELVVRPLMDEGETGMNHFNNEQFSEKATVECPFPFLLNFKTSVEKEYKNLIPILSTHEYLVQWLREVCELALEMRRREEEEHLNKLPKETNEPPIEVTSDNHSILSSESLESIPVLKNSTFMEQKEIPNSQQQQHELPTLIGLKRLLFMFEKELEDNFSYFQKQHQKYVKKWLELSVKDFPSYIIDILHKKRKQFLHYHSFKMSEEDLNLKTIVDSDFDFVEFMCDHTEDWKVLIGEHPRVVVYKSKENYSCVPNMKLQKSIIHLNYSIEKVAKAALNNEIEGQKQGMFECMEYHHYTPLDRNVSSRKYSTVIQTCIMNYGAIFKKRALENVISTKARFFGDQLMEVTYLYKTCSYVNPKNEQAGSPVKVVVFGGKQYIREDVNRTRVVDVRLFNIGGFMNHDLVVHKLAIKKVTEDFVDYYVSKMKDAEKNGHATPDPKEQHVWRTFSEYCQAHYDVDVNQW